ncbi:MAG: hypothetical protein HPY53_14960 [Brevinematales bacterium]|nr:hypothetical protein [Brevinematales bacterium]
MKKFFEKISHSVNLNELVFDATLTLSAFILYRLVVPKSGFLFITNDLTVIIAVIICTQFLISLLLFGILRNYDDMREAALAGNSRAIPQGNGISARINTWLIKAPLPGVLLFLIICVAITGLYILMPMKAFNIIDQITIQAPDSDPNRFLGMFISFLAGSAVILPGVILFKITEAGMRWFFIVSIPFVYEFLAIPFSVVYFAMQGGAWGAILFVLITAGVITGIVLLKRYLMEENRATPPLLKKFGVLSRTWIIPFFTALAMLVYNEMSLASAANDLVKSGLDVNLLNIFPLLLLSGIIPIRAIMLLSPPVRVINLVISVITLVLFFTNIESVLGRLSGIITLP